MCHNHNSAKIYTSSSCGELRVSLSNSKQVITATNNKAKYYSDLAKAYRDEAKQYSEDAQKNTNVTHKYIDDIKLALEAEIAGKQDSGNYALVSQIPVNNSQLNNDSDFQDEEDVRDIILDYVPAQTNANGKFLMSDGSQTKWVNVTDYTSEFRNIIKSCKLDGQNQPDLFTVQTAATEKIQPWSRPNLTSDGTPGGDTYAAFSSADSAQAAYLAFNEDTSNANSNAWFSKNNSEVHWCGLYSPNPFKCESVTIRNASSDHNIYYCKGGRIEASNDNTNWTIEATFTNTTTSNGAYWTVNLENPIYAKYRRIVSTSSAYNGNYVGISNIAFNNTTQKVPVIAGNSATLNVSEENPLQIIVPDGRNIKIKETSSFSLADKSDGLYPIFVDDGGEIYIADGFYVQNTKPSNLDNSKLYFWMNTSSVPNKLYKLSNETEVEFQAIHVATITLEQNLIDKIEYQNIANMNILNDFIKKGVPVESAGFPSGNYTELTLGASGTSYIAPETGYFVVRKGSGVSNSYMTLSGGGLINSSHIANTASTHMIYLPACKGTQITVSYNCSGDTEYFRFVKALGV